MDTLVGRKPPHSDGNGKLPGKSSATHKSLITRNLKLAFGQVTSEQVPDRWLQLLDQLDENEEKKQ
ncbi:MAG: NepR family anti-sigma factor [Vitreimonas sp.]